jgi:molybdopterin synthase sulfur carrier subunit
MNVLYFAWVRQKAGVGEERLDLPSGVTSVRELAVFLRARGGGFTEAFGDLSRLRAAVNQEHVSFDTAIGPNDEVAFFPPVTGG